MTTESDANFFSDPAFQKALADIQEERWADGIAQLRALQEKYPFETALRRFHQEVVVKARIDDYEVEDIEKARRIRSRRLLTRIGIFVGAFVFVLLASTTYAGVIESQVTRVQSSLQEDFADIELAIKFRNGQNLLASGRAEEALVLFEEIEAVNPDYPNLEDFIGQARGLLSVKGQYETAVGLLDQGRWADALKILEAIEAEQPNYLNVPLLIDRADRNINLGNLVAAADEAYAAGDWATAVIRYESVRISDVEFRRDHVELRLFDSYIKAAEEVIDDPAAELEELEIAEGYFQKALSLRPQNDDVIRIWNRARDTVRARLVARYLGEAEAALVNKEDSIAALQIAENYFENARRLDPDNEEIAQKAEFASRYLAAVNDFRASLWDLVITNLEFIYAFEPEYASGTTRQILYDARIIRGDNALATGDYEAALDDYRRAIEISLDNPNGGALSTYEAQLKVGFTLGLLLDYDGAVLMYQTAMETGELRERFSESDPNLIAAIDAADALALQGQTRLAYIRYRDTFNQNQLIYSEFITHTVREGEYLSQIARIYNSSIQVIARANGLADPNRIIAGQDLIIPIFPDE